MEYGLRQLFSRAIKEGGYVLILVLMEYGLRRLQQTMKEKHSPVLILVLMEYGLRHFDRHWKTFCYCLNPCFNGIWSATRQFSTWRNFDMPS